MKFNIKISKWGAFYFFVQNLSEWHFSNRKDYNIFWKEILGTFSVQENDILNEFKEIRLRYSQSKSCFEKAFFLSEHPLEGLSSVLTKREYQTIRDAFSLLENKFNLLYEKDLPLLNGWKETLSMAVGDQKLTDTILNYLNTLYKTSVQKKEINLYLLPSTLAHTGGGANIDNESVSIEISRYPLENVKHILSIIWHEIIHLYFQNQHFYLLLVKIFPNEEQRVNFINEVVASSLFPRGMLSMRLLGNKPAAKLLPGINEQQTIRILNLTKEYIDESKSFDENYIEKLSLIIK